MTLLPYMAAFITSTIGWALGKTLGGIYLGAVSAMVLGVLGWYYMRKYVKSIMEG